MDLERAERVAEAAKMMLDECQGEPFEVRKRFAMLVPVIRGHKFTPESFSETPTGAVGRCNVCEQLVKVMYDGKGISGLAIENDCPAAEWRRP
jgi:hypothetical protein